MAHFPRGPGVPWRSGDCRPTQPPRTPCSRTFYRACSLCVPFSQGSSPEVPARLLAPPTRGCPQAQEPRLAPPAGQAVLRLARRQRPDAALLESLLIEINPEKVTGSGQTYSDPEPPPWRGERASSSFRGNQWHHIDSMPPPAEMGCVLPGVPGPAGSRGGAGALSRGLTFPSLSPQQAELGPAGR